ncbi:MAG: hypothetical protein WAU78_15735 [Roseiarcus sp.]
MATPILASFRRRHWLVAAGFLAALPATPLPAFEASAGERQDASGAPADREESPPPSSQRPVDNKESGARWTFSAEAIGLARFGGVDRTLVARVPGSVPYLDPLHLDTSNDPGVAAFNSNQFRQGFSAGPKLSLIYRDDSGYGVELSYFNIFNQSATKAVGPDGDWLVMKAPGTFWQTQDFPDQAMVWKATTSLYSAEANGRLTLSGGATVLAGVRWLQLNDGLQGTLTPADARAPTWKQNQNCADDDLSEVPSCLPPGGPAGNYPPFWTTNATNALYGVQVGAEGTLLELGRWSLDGLLKVGLYDDNARQGTGVSLKKVVHPSSAQTNRAAFASEANVRVKYRISDSLALKVGYEALWLDGVALAPGQIQETLTLAKPRALGVNCGSNVLFQGATFGLEVTF